MAVGNSLQRSNQNQKVGFTAYLTNNAVQNQINKVVGGKNGQRFITSIISAVQTNHALQECTNASILNAALLGETLKLSPSPQLGYYYMVPYNDKNKGLVAQFQMGYKGYIQLALRSGQYKRLNVMPVKEGELEYFDPMNEEIKINQMVSDWNAYENAKTIGYYAMFELTNGFRKSMYWSKEKMLAHADKFSAAFSKDATTVHTRYGDKKKVSFADYEAGKYDPKDEQMYSSFWYKNFDEMAFKTMLRQLISKWGPMEIDSALTAAVDYDMAVVNEDMSKNYVDIEEPETIYSQETESQQVQNQQVSPADAKSALFS